MNFVSSLGCIQLKMTPKEVINATTINTAYAMGVSDKLGSIAVGKKANLFITKPMPSYAYLPYAFGHHHIETIILNGERFKPINMSRQIIECVPNISEGRDQVKIKTISEIVETVEGVKLLNVDPGKATNRTVITFVGEPQQVIDAAFLLIKKAQELIDMSKHSGEHPRMGATDVCPLVPIANISMEETTEWAHKLGARVGADLGIPIYCYESAAKEENRKNLANCRSGEYEGLSKKLVDTKWKPDFGPAEFNDSVAKSGATAISSRDFLVAYNINLNTTSTRRANAVAFDIREAGRLKERR